MLVRTDPHYPHPILQTLSRRGGCVLEDGVRRVGSGNEINGCPGSIWNSKLANLNEPAII